MVVLSRRCATTMLFASAFAAPASFAWSEPNDPVIGLDAPVSELNFPPFESLDQPELFGFDKPTEEQRAKAEKIILETPKGPTPYAVAQSFISRFAKADPDAISQWPAPKAWNPLVKEFFSATSLRVSNDMIDWCAAFINWCIERNNKKGTNSAASQSFVTSGLYRKTEQPAEGNLVVFTCYNKQTGANMGLGHVAFFQAFEGQDRVRVIGGNQSADGHSSIICERKFLAKPFDVTRHVNGVAVPCIYKLNSFLVVE